MVGCWDTIRVNLFLAAITPWLLMWYLMKKMFIYCVLFVFYVQNTFAHEAIHAPYKTSSVRERIYTALQQNNKNKEILLNKEIVTTGAKLAQSFGNDISSSHASKIAGSMASGALNNSIQNDLGRFGRANVNFNLNNTKFEGSELDFLMPLHETTEHLMFSQVGGRRINDRTMANVGFGYRYFPSENNMMLGANIFYDYDFSRKHQRFGAGLEYAKDYFRVSTNGYWRLSDWKISPDFADYHERVANGFDISTEAWLPVYPQLGGKFVYTHFYGNQVGMRGPDDLQKNPELFTLGLSYTPVPLVGVLWKKTVSAKGTNNNNSFELNFSYKFGIPLKEQLNPDHVRYNRTLVGSRYELVSRNNYIVLDYKKDKLFSISEEYITGLEGSKQKLNLKITSRYDIKGVTWNVSDFFQFGGDVVYEKNGYQIVFPEWKDGFSNHYVLEGEAIDEKGNVSPPFKINVDVLPMAIKISLAGNLKGEEGQPLAIGLNARAENAIKSVDWTAPEYFSAGGKFVKNTSAPQDTNSLNYYAILPPYKNDGSNEYNVKVTVVDVNGNISNTATTKITVEPRTIVLKVPEYIFGTEYKQIKLPLKISSKYPVNSFRWEAHDFISHGGGIVIKDNDIWLYMPAWIKNSKNQYPLVLTAIDKDGRNSEAVRTTIVVSSSTINLDIERTVSGISGQQITLFPKVTSDATLERIEWNGDAFFRAGGGVISVGGGYKLRLPIWKKDDSNQYVIYVTAYDSEGRFSNTIPLSVKVLPSEIIISTQNKLEGPELGTLPLTIKVMTNEASIEGISFTAEKFLASGGKILGTIPDFQVVLPAWKESGDNNYEISVTAKDVNGNISEPKVIVVNVEQAPLKLSGETSVTATENSIADVKTITESLYGISHYLIDAEDFKNAGGGIIQDGDLFKLKIPGFNVGGDNRYTIVIRVVDTIGRISSPLELHIVVTSSLTQCSVVGGGNGYSAQINKEKVNYQEARNYTELKSLVDRGEKFIYIPGDVEIEVPLVKNALSVKSGTTIFSDRGSNGSYGAKLKVPYIDEKDYKFPVIVMDSDSRISGLVYEGPYQGTITNNTTIGIQTLPGSKNVEIDNIEVFGWPWAAISIKQSSNVRVHHSYIHNNIKSQLGYGVVTQEGNATAEVACNVFDSNRHAIAGRGEAGEGYIARHNLVLNGGGRGAYHQFDMHPSTSGSGIAGEFMQITENWFDFGRYGTSNRSSIVVRGQPTDGPVTITDNWFSQGWKVGNQFAVTGVYGKWVPTVDEILSANHFNVNFKYLDKGYNQCVIDWLGSSQAVNCAGVGY